MFASFLVLLSETIDDIDGLPYYTTIFPLAEQDFGILEMLLVVVIDVAVFGYERVRALELIGRLFAGSVGLAGVALDADIGVESAAVVDYFEDVGVPFHYQ